MTAPSDPKPPKKHLTPSYLVFYILFNEDTWRFLIGIALAVILAPFLLPFDRTGIGRYIMFIAVVVVGWAVAKAPSRWIVQQLRLLFPRQ